MSFWKPAEDPGTRRLRSWVFDIGCAVVAFVASLAHFSFAQTAHPATCRWRPAWWSRPDRLALPLRRVWPGPVFLWTVLVAAVLAEWPTTARCIRSRWRSACTPWLPHATGGGAHRGGAHRRPWSLRGRPGRHAHSGARRLRRGRTAAAVLIVGLYVSTRRAYLAELRDRAQPDGARTGPEHRAGRGGGTGADRPGDARQRGPSAAQKRKASPMQKACHCRGRLWRRSAPSPAGRRAFSASAWWACDHRADDGSAESLAASLAGGPVSR